MSTEDNARRIANLLRALESSRFGHRFTGGVDEPLFVIKRPAKPTPQEFKTAEAIEAEVNSVLDDEIGDRRGALADAAYQNLVFYVKNLLD